jgi:hypothetical protein
MAYRGATMVRLVGTLTTDWWRSSASPPYPRVQPWTAEDFILEGRRPSRYLPARTHLYPVLVPFS